MPLNMNRMLESTALLIGKHVLVENSPGGQTELLRKHCFIFSFEKAFVKGETGKMIKAHEREMAFFVLSLLS